MAVGFFRSEPGSVELPERSIAATTAGPATSMLLQTKQEIEQQPRSRVVHSFYEATSDAVGANGRDVLRIKTILKNAGYYEGQISSDFDRDLTKAVRNFQTASGIPDDGIIGPWTVAALTKTGHWLQDPDIFTS